MPQHHLVIPDCVEVTHNLAVAGRTVHVVNHCRVPVGQGINPTLADTVFTAMRNLWTSNLASLCPPSTGYTGLTLRDLRDQGQPLVPSAATEALGTATGIDTLPRQLAACLTLRTNRAGRAFRGRSYWTGFGEAANGTDNRYSATMVTGINAFAAGYRVAMSTGGLTLAVAHRPTVFDASTGLPIAPGLGFITDVTTVSSRDTIWDSQRRRAG